MKKNSSIKIGLVVAAGTVMTHFLQVEEALEMAQWSFGRLLYPSLILRRSLSLCSSLYLGEAFQLYFTLSLTRRDSICTLLKILAFKDVEFFCKR
jgi:hypothetical protein